MPDYKADEKAYFEDKVTVYSVCFTREQAEHLATISVEARRAKLEVEKELEKEGM